MRTRWLALLVAALFLFPLAAHADLGQRVTDALKAGSLLAYVLVFVGGVGTSLTPCVYPLIPITLSIFGAGHDVTRSKALARAAAYVGGICVMYTSLGVTFALAGKAFGTFMANPWVMVPIAVVFLVMAASMFGAFELNLPPSLHERLNRVGGSGFAGAFAMGLVSGIIAAPCTGPVLASILTYVATTRSVVFGGSVLFVYALGMGVLFFVLAGTGASLPKSGAWMDTVKSVFGVVMIVAALYFLRNVVPQLKHYGSWTTMFAGVHSAVLAAGVIIGGIHLSFYGPIHTKLRKALGIGLICFGAFGLIAWVMTPKPFAWVHGETAGLAAMKAEGKPAVVDFGADWCNPCKKLEISLFGDEEVRRELARFVAVKIDVSEDNDENDKLRARYGASTLPTIVILDRDGKTAHRYNEEEIKPEEFIERLKTVP